MVDSVEIITKSPQETSAIGEEIGARLISYGAQKGERIWCLYGDLGSGKTTFAQGLAKGLGLGSRLLSPTFIIVRRYKLPKNFQFLYHADLYRISSPAEAASLGLSEMVSETDSIMIIEWPEKVPELIPKERTDIFFILGREGVHRLNITRHTL